MQKNNLRQARQQAGMTQQDLAKALLVSSALVSRWEHGSCAVREVYIGQIADILGVTRDRLVNEEASKPRSDPNVSVASSVDVRGIDKRVIAYQGRPGAYSHLACQSRFPDFRAQAYASFDDCFTAVETGDAGLAMIPIENSLGGRVADIHHILPHSGLYIVDEHFQPVQHMLWGVEGARLGDIRKVMSHSQALTQCRRAVQSLKAEAVDFADTAGACEYIAGKGDKSLAALASPLAGEVYGLQNLRQNMEDRLGNMTRFIVMSRIRIEPDVLSGNCLTGFIFTLRSLPAALYKCLGGFATNGVNFIKLESYIPIADRDETASFYAEIEGHIADKAVERAFQELHYYTTKVKVLGTFPKNPYRQTQ